MIKRTHYCGTLGTQDEHKTVRLCGWVDAVRNHGGVVFIDLRDRSGTVQIVFKPESGKELADQAAKIHLEYVLGVEGTVLKRAPQNVNEDIPTGRIEVEVKQLQLFNRSNATPFQIEDDVKTDEMTRMKYRYLDLRRPVMARNLIQRHKVTNAIRNYFDQAGFLEIETPILWKSTPEGARDYLVPSRLHHGRFYALPQSPQVCKQLFMIAGLDRYYQIARCFRDEDLRADRQPEFTQLDIEMSFVEPDDVFVHLEGALKRVWKDALNIDLKTPFPRMTYHEAVAKYGCDKPDLRFGLELKEISDLVKNVEFGVFKNCVGGGGIVKGLCVKGKAEQFTRKQIDELTAFVGARGAKGLAWFKVENNAFASPIAKFFKPDEQTAIRQRMGADNGDILFFVADTKTVANTALSQLRNRLGAELKLYNKNDYYFTWVLDFPLFEWSEEDKRFAAMHHPFTSPKNVKDLDGDLGNIASNAYDLVCNGYELGSGSIRIHDQAVQAKMFELLQITPEDAKERFGFFLEALSYGTPPHGGMALGIDRIAMIVAGEDDIRQVVAFPKTQSAACPMTGAPSPVPDDAVGLLGIQLKK